MNRKTAGIARLTLAAAEAADVNGVISRVAN
jgi:hypothetical protein